MLIVVAALKAQWVRPRQPHDAERSLRAVDTNGHDRGAFAARVSDGRSIAAGDGDAPWSGLRLAS